MGGTVGENVLETQLFSVQQNISSMATITCAPLHRKSRFTGIFLVGEASTTVLSGVMVEGEGIESYSLVTQASCEQK